MQFTHLKKFIAIVLILCMFMSAFTVIISADGRIDYLEMGLDDIGLPMNTEVDVVVVFEGDYLAGIENATGKLNEADQKAMLKGIAKQQLGLVERIKTKGKVTVTNTFDTLFNGVSIKADLKTVAMIRKMPGVKGVYFDERVYPLATRKETIEETISMVGANVLTGADSAVSEGYNGDGVLVAVIDTGIDYKHECFKDTSLLKNPALTEEAAKEKINELGHGTYVSEKIPYMYDYYYNDDDAMDFQGHGTHCASVVAGYVPTEDGGVAFQGVAPAAQIAFFKTFSDNDGFTSSTYYLHAFEDAYKLGVDIISCSWGTQNGFSHNDMLMSDLLGDVYDTIRKAGIITVCAAGNNYNMHLGASYDYTYPVNDIPLYPADYLDNGTVGNPAFFEPNLSVASYNNIVYYFDVFGVDNDYIYFTDASKTDDDMNFKEFMSEYPEGIEYVLVPGFGAPQDYNGIDVFGKVAVVNRGEISFNEKLLYAYGHGAVALIVCNYDDENVAMQIENYYIPAVLIPKTNADKLKAATVQKLLYVKDPQPLGSPLKDAISDFSSRGPTSALDFEPDITGVGSYIYAADALTGGYISYEGTSMACPDVAGNIAIILQYLKGKYNEYSKSELAEYALDLAKCTSTILEDEFGEYYSPRLQGAGLINSYNAITADKYAYIKHSDTALYDNPAKNPIYDFSSELVNMSGMDMDYDASLWVSTPPIIQINDDVFTNLDYTESVALSEKSGTLSDSFVNTITIDLSEESYDGDFSVADYLDLMPYGTYIEGFAIYSFDEIEIHSTYLGFYGEWGEAPSMEDYDILQYYDIISFLMDEFELSMKDISAYVDHFGCKTVEELFALIMGINTPNLFGCTNLWLCNLDAGKMIFYAGCNAFDCLYSDYKKLFVPNALNEDAQADCLVIIPSMLRNSANLVMVVYDPETLEVYFTDNILLALKDKYDYNTDEYESLYGFFWDGTNAEGDVLESGTNAVMKFYSWLDYEEDDVLALLPEGVSANDDILLGEALIGNNAFDKYAELSYDVCVDYISPEIEYVWDAATSKLTVSAVDENFLQILALTDGEGEYITTTDDDGNPFVCKETYNDEEAGIRHEMVVDLSKYVEDGAEEVWIHAVDYASNYPMVWVDLTKKMDSNIPVNVTTVCDEHCTILTDSPCLYDDLIFAILFDEGWGIGENTVITVSGGADSYYYDEEFGWYVIPSIQGDVTITVSGSEDIGLPIIDYEIPATEIFTSEDIPVYANAVNIKFTASDNETGLDENGIEYFVMKDPGTFVLDSFDDVVWSKGIEAAIDENGTYIVVAKAADCNNNVNFTMTDIFIVVTNGPELVITEIGFDLDETVTSNNAKLSVSVVDSLVLNPTANVSMNGNEKTYTFEDGSFIIDELPEGSTEIIITATDICGNETIEKFTVTKDTVAPEAVNLKDGDTVVGPFEVEIDADDLFGVTVDNVAVEVGNGKFVLLPSENSAERVVKIMDVNGNVRSLTVTVKDGILHCVEGSSAIVDNNKVYIDSVKSVDDVYALFENDNITVDGIVKTGAVITVEGETEYTLIVRGDINCDGKVSVSDYIEVRKALLGISEIEGLSLDAGDFTSDGKLTTADYIILRLMMLGIN